MPNKVQTNTRKRFSRMRTACRLYPVSGSMSGRVGTHPHPLGHTVLTMDVCAPSGHTPQLGHTPRGPGTRDTQPLLHVNRQTSMKTLTCCNLVCGR